VKLHPTLLAVPLLAIAFSTSAAEGLVVYPDTIQQMERNAEDHPLAAVGLRQYATSPASAANVVSPPMPLLLDVQDELKKRGYRIGDDGVLGQDTRAALMDFQWDQALIPTGRPDNQTLSALGLEALRD